MPVENQNLKGNKKRTLYVSDLDGTLLRSDETVSEYTCSVINALSKKGIYFSYATARSAVTAQKVTQGLKADIPIIVYNGAFILENRTQNPIVENYFSEEDARTLLQRLLEHAVYPLVYAYADGRERYAYLDSKINRATRSFVQSRNDARRTPVGNAKELFQGRLFYLTCIGEEEKLSFLYEQLKARFQCIYQQDIYSNEPWLEILPQAATKANAVLQLKEKLGCERVVAFGDGENDCTMFSVADESYAVANAVPSLKRLATGLIGGNNEDSVAKWLAENAAF